jgi:ankyrin repeat protein
MNQELTAVLAKIADVPDFAGIEVKSVNTRNPLGDSPLHVAAIWRDVVIGKILLNAGADPNAQGEHGYTPLHEAVEQEHLEFARLLLEKGASGDIENDDGVTPAGMAKSNPDPQYAALFQVS